MRECEHRERGDMRLFFNLSPVIKALLTKFTFVVRFLIFRKQFKVPYIVKSILVRVILIKNFIYNLKIIRE